MRLTNFFFLLFAAFLVCSAFSLKKEKKTVYAFGFSASFTDTVVYYTEIQPLDSVFLDKNGFLPYRDFYSYQLKNYLENEKGEKNRICMIYFSENKSKLNKEFTDLVNRYKKNKTLKLLSIKQQDFSFRKPEN